MFLLTSFNFVFCFSVARVYRYLSSELVSGCRFKDWDELLTRINRSLSRHEWLYDVHE